MRTTTFTMTTRAAVCAVVLSCLTSFACGDSKSPTAPSNPPTPTPTVVSLTGSVSAQGGARLAGATVRIFDGLNVGKTATTNSNGEYRIDGLTAANGNVDAVADGYEKASGGLYIDGTKSLNFTLRTTIPWSKSGAGNIVFDMPTYIRRVRIIADFGGNSSNFIVHVGGEHIVNELMGTFWKETHYEGVHVVPGGVTETIESNGVSWAFIEER